jgi:hypothetical protein
MYETNFRSILCIVLSLKNYIFQSYETAIMRFHVSEVQKGNHTAVGMQLTAKNYARDLTIKLNIFKLHVREIFFCTQKHIFKTF